MYSIRNLSVFSSITLLTLLSISFYHGIISPPPLITFTTDENFIGEQGVFLLYGNTPKDLEWPAIPSIFIAYLIFILWCGIILIFDSASINNLSDILTVFDKNAFYYLNNREEFVIWERWIQLILVVFIIYLTVRYIINSKNPILKPEIKFILIFLCVCSDTIWATVSVVRPEAISGSLFLFLVINILFSEKITLKVATIFIIIFILIFSQRLIFLSFSPFIIGSIVIHLRKQKISFRNYLYGLGIIILAFFAMMPFIITDTLVIFKSFFGTIFVKVNDHQMNSYFNVSFINDFIVSPFNIIFSLFNLAGMYFFIKFYPIKSTAIIFILNFLFILFYTLKSAQLYNTHTFPLSMMAGIIITYGIYGLITYLKEKQKKLILGVLSLCIISGTLLTIQKNKNITVNQQQNLSDAINWIKTLNNNDKIILSLDFDGFVPKNKPCLLREYEANASENYRMNKLNSLLKNPSTDSINKFMLPVLAQSFAFDDEKLFDTKYHIALKYIDLDSIKRFDTDYFYENNINMSHCYVQNVALKRFKDGKYQYLVSQQQLSGFKPLKTFNKNGGKLFWAYEFKEE